MHGSTIDRASSGDECLTGDLTAEDTLDLLVRTDATKDVDFDGFQVEQAHDRVEGGLRHPVILPRSGNPPLFLPNGGVARVRRSTRATVLAQAVALLRRVGLQPSLRAVAVVLLPLDCRLARMDRERNRGDDQRRAGLPVE